MPSLLAVCSSDLVLSPPDRRMPMVHALKSPDGQSLDAALAEMYVFLEQHEHVIVLYPSSTPGPVTRRLHTVRSMLESGRIALLETQLPPLGTAVLVHQLRQLSMYDFGPGVLGSAALLLTHYIHAGAVLNSVAKLDRVPISLKAHARSWVPGSQFGVVANPVPQLIKIDDEATLSGPEFATHMTLASDRLSSDWVRRKLATSWPVQALHEVRLPAESGTWWGTDKLVEFVAAIPDPHMLYQLVNSVQRQTCDWCGVERIGTRCVFCPASPEAPQNRTDAGGVRHAENSSTDAQGAASDAVSS